MNSRKEYRFPDGCSLANRNPSMLGSSSLLWDNHCTRRVGLDFMPEQISITITVLALCISALTAWLTLFRRGTVKMTQPTVIFLDQTTRVRGMNHRYPRSFSEHCSSRQRNSAASLKACTSLFLGTSHNKISTFGFTVMKGWTAGVDCLLAKPG